MARKPTARQLYAELLERYGQQVADAFAAVVRDLRRAADLQALQAAVQARNVEAALAATKIDPAAYGPLLDAIERGYAEAGKGAADLLPARNPDGAALLFRFDVRNPRAANWIREYGANLVRQVVDDQKAAIRTALVAGMEAGRGPRTVALDIIGRTNKATGQREGGVIGLTSTQGEAVRKAEAELASGDPVQMRNYLTRNRRDKRFDRSIQKAIREETAPPADLIAKATTRYQARLLELRGQVIGRTEALAALNASQYEALRQAVETGQLQASQVRRVWKSAYDGRVRDTHAALSGDTAGLDESFRSPSGAFLRYPGDPSAPIAERANCRCWVMPRIDWSANVV